MIPLLGERYVKIKLQGVEHIAFIDGGAALSFVDRTIGKELGRSLRGKRGILSTLNVHGGCATMDTVVV